MKTAFHLLLQPKYNAICCYEGSFKCIFGVFLRIKGLSITDDTYVNHYYTICKIIVTTQVIIYTVYIGIVHLFKI